MSIPLPISGFRRFILGHGPGGELLLRDDSGADVLRLRAKPGPHARARIQEISGRAAYRVVGHRIGDPHRVTVVGADGGSAAVVVSRLHVPGDGALAVTMSTGAQWHLKGSFADATYSAAMAGQRILRVTAGPDGTRVLDLDPGIDPGLALAIVWAIDWFPSARGPAAER